MTLQSSGPISFSQIENEFGGSGPVSLSGYYSLDAGIPASGTITFSNFYGKILNATRTISSNTNNFNSRSDFTNATIVGGKKTATAVYNANQAVKYYITNNAQIGSTSTGAYSFDTGTWASGSSIYLTNNNYIIGAGGNGGSYSGGNGGNGGPALNLQITTYITNNSTIAGGGGGGGAGSDNTVSYTVCANCLCTKTNTITNTAYAGGGGGGAGIIVGPGGSSSGNPGQPGSTFTGGAPGPGYSSGRATSSGGGAGGNLGARGNNSFGSGGAAGNYVTGNSFAIWITNGTLLGGSA